MRRIQTTDIFGAARIIRASGVREDLRTLIQNVAESGLSVESVGIDGFLLILEAAAEKKTEHAIYEVLSGPFEVEPGQIAVMELDELLERLNQLYRENDLQRFFGFVSRILGKK